MAKSIPWADFAFGIPIANNRVQIAMPEASLTDRVEVDTACSPETPTAPVPPQPSPWWNARFAWRAALVAVLLAAIYYDVVARLVANWWQIPDFSHGFLVPPFAAYLIWEKRRTLLALKPAPSWSGIGIIIFAILTLLLGLYGAELFLSRVSLVILLAGLVLLFGGRPFLTELRFPLLILILAIPLPALIMNQVTFPLQIFASKVASTLLPVFGVPVLREGNVIVLPLMRLEVAEACSGIRSLMSLFTMAVFYGYFMERSTARRAILALASIPIAIAANAVRILGTGLCVQYWDPDKAMGFFHEFSGWVIFLVSLTCLFALHRVMSLFPLKRRQSA
jgi:exosortase